MSYRHTVLMTAALLLSACSSVDSSFRCGKASECQLNGATGVCQMNGLCSFPDAACPTGQRYGSLSGMLAGQCVDPRPIPDGGSGNDQSASTDLSGASSSTDLASSDLASLDLSGASPSPSPSPSPSAAPDMAITMGGGCFVAGTPITMADGSRRPIDLVRSGDAVLSFDVSAGRAVVSTVTQTFVHESAAPTVLINGAVRATGNHPFFVNGAWAAAETIRPGDGLLTVAGDVQAGVAPLALAVGSIATLAPVERVYNLEVDRTHCYFAGGLLVHNRINP